jgi:hypothetical protein
MRTFLAGFALSLLLLPASAMADVVTWNTYSGYGASPRSTQGSGVNTEMTFTASSGEVLKARAFYIEKSNGVANRDAPLKKAQLKIYDQGLGVTSNGECSSCSPQHALDNVGTNELIVFQLPSDNWDPTSVTLVPYGYPYDTDVTFLVGGSLAQFPDLASFENKSIQYLLENGFQEYESKTNGSGERTVSIPGDATGRYLIVASWLNETKPDDDFKVKTIASKPGTTTQVSEPATMALLTFGLCAFAAYRRRTHYGGA